MPSTPNPLIGRWKSVTPGLPVIFTFTEETLTIRDDDSEVCIVNNAPYSIEDTGKAFILEQGNRISRCVFKQFRDGLAVCDNKRIYTLVPASEG